MTHRSLFVIRIITGVAVVATLGLASCSESSRVLDSQQPAEGVPAGQLLLDGGEQQTLEPDALQAAFAALALSGMEVSRVSGGAGEHLLMVKIQLEMLEPVLLGGRQGISALQALEDVQLVVGSGFVSQVNSLAPVGLLQIDGRTVSDMQVHGYTRILGIRPEGLGILGHRDFHRGMYDSALQVGPGIVEEGLLDITERDLTRTKYLRTFVATCDRVALVGATQRPMHLFTLGQRLLEFMQAENMDCDEVVNLAGDREVILAMTSADRSRIVYFGHPHTAKAALLGFKFR